MGNDDSPAGGTDQADPIRLLAALQNDPAALEKVLAKHRDRLRRMVARRLDRRLQGRVDASEMIQEACRAARRLPEYVREPKPMPFFLWIRFLVAQSSQVQHRNHLGVMAPDAGRTLHVTSVALAAQLLGHETRASQAAILAEHKLRLEPVLNMMDPPDREFLALRHVEQLSNSECARVLGLKVTTATKRHIRALGKLQALMKVLPGSNSVVRE
jgi:RNA polymerase sigma-70 factor, ECF subfamily